LTQHEHGEVDGDHAGGGGEANTYQESVAGAAGSACGDCDGTGNDCNEGYAPQPISGRF